MNEKQLRNFIIESNRIEGIHRPIGDAEYRAYEQFLALPEIRVIDLENLVDVVQSSALLRDEVGLDVRVGDHYPPLGGKVITGLLEYLLARMEGYGPYKTHLEYENLHPFTDGNSRSGRALWLWQVKEAPLGFLHHWYYLSLEASR